MAEEVERSAASVEEALEAALEQLGITEQQAADRDRAGTARRFPRAEEPGGDRSRPCQARPDRGAEPRRSSRSRRRSPRTSSTACSSAWTSRSTWSPRYVDGIMYVDVWGAESDEGMGLLIGKHGQTLEALQEIVRGAVQRKTGERCRILVDVEDYRKRRRSQITSRARQVGGPRAQERPRGGARADAGVRAQDRARRGGGAGRGPGDDLSEGEEPNRRVVIRPSDELVSRETGRARPPGTRFT